MSFKLENINPITPQNRNVLGKQYDESTVTFSSTPTGWTLTRAVFVPYKTTNDVWRLKFNIYATVTGFTGSITTTIDGVTFKTGVSQSFVYEPLLGGKVGLGWTTGGGGTIRFNSEATSTNIIASGDVELDGKPTWAEDVDAAFSLVEDNLSEWIAIPESSVSNLTTNIYLEGGYYRRVGDTVEVNAGIEFSAANTEGMVQPIIPASLTPDTSKLLTGFSSPSSRGDITIGSWQFNESSSGRNWSGSVTYKPGDDYIRLVDADGDFDVNTNSDRPVVIGDGDTLTWQYKLPVTEFAGTQNSLVAFSDATSERSGLVKKNTALKYTLSADQAIPSNKWTKLQFNTKVFDIGDEWDGVTNYRFTPTEAGYYSVHSSIMIDNLSSLNAGYVSIYKNGASVSIDQRSTYAASKDIVPKVSDLIYLTTSDYIEIFANHDFGSDRNILDATQYTFVIIKREII